MIVVVTAASTWGWEVDKQLDPQNFQTWLNVAGPLIRPFNTSLLRVDWSRNRLLQLRYKTSSQMGKHEV
jgi:hypothetical protein